MHGKWRPSLSLVVLAILSLIGALPLISLSFLRLYENQLIRAAEGELVGQSAMLAAAYAQAIARYPDHAALLGPAMPARLQNPTDAAIEPALDLTADPILPERPEAGTPARPPRPTAVMIGLELTLMIESAKTLTLAGFRVLDKDGTIVGGGLDIGRSLAELPEVQSALAGRFQAVMRTRNRNEPTPPLYSISRGTGIRVFTAMPVLVEGRLAGVIYGSRTPNNLVRQIYAERAKIGLAGAVLVGAIGLIAFVFARVFTRPIYGLAARAAALGRGEAAPGTGKTHYGTREVALLAQSVDDMAQRLRERSDYIATFAAHVSHELKSPLTAIQGGAELMRDALDDPDGPMPQPAQRRFLDNIVADAARLATLLGRLRELARADNPRIHGSTDLGAIADRLRAGFPDLTVAVHGGTDAAIPLSPENADIVFGHLADNAAHHGAHRLELEMRAQGDHLAITVENDGSPIPPGVQAQAFESFFTTRRAGGGTGMGLTIVRAMLAAHDGRIAILPSPSGAKFEIILARASRESRTIRPVAPAAKSQVLSRAG